MKVFQLILQYIALLPFLVQYSNATLRFHSYYSDGMVLQRSGLDGTEADAVTVWGYGDDGDDTNNGWSILCEANQGLERFTGELSGLGEGVERFSGKLSKLDEGVWSAKIPSRAAGSVCTIKISNGEEMISLKDVLFGDVWLCSGQSNMELNMSMIMDAKSEIENSANYTEIRFTVISNIPNQFEDDNLDVSIDIPWTDSSNGHSLAEMSAICYLYARTVYEQTGVPQGLIAADWGGSPIETWMDDVTLSSCGVPPAPDWICEDDYQHGMAFCNSYLWNGMINPLKRNSLAGFLWYQGETNGGYDDTEVWGNYNRDLYNCTFPAMIQSWRKHFSSSSGTPQDAPFGFVQLASWRYDSFFASFPVIRWHQTADVGYVPNEKMSNVFMAAALDTYDSKEGYPGNLHPRYKQIVAYRLALAGLSIKYGYDTPTKGPFPQLIYSTDDIISGPKLIISYDQTFKYDKTEISGFYYCVDQLQCDSGEYVDMWNEIGRDDVNQRDENIIEIDLDQVPELTEPGVFLAYIWRETPVLEYLGLPIYADDNVGLPSPPWKKQLNLSLIK